MRGVDEIGKIRRIHFRDGRSIRGISRDLGVSRVTARKVLRSEATPFSYERRTHSGSKIDPWRSELDAVLSENASRPKRERMALTRTFEDLRSLGYEAGYGAVWRKDRDIGSVSDAHAPQSFDPGEAYQFD